MFKVNKRNTRTRCDICSKLTINTPEQRQWRRSGVFIVNFERILHLGLVFLLLTSSRQMTAGKWLLNELFRLGFCIIYPEVTRFKHSVLAIKYAGAEGALNSVFTQWVVNNVDQNICTLDGKGTFRDMRVIVVDTKERQ